MKSVVLLTLSLVLMTCAARPSRLAGLWPGSAEDEFLYWCIPEGDGVWPVYEGRPTGCRDEKVSRGEWDFDRLPLSVNAEPELVTETMEAIDAFNALVGFRMYRFEHANMDPDVAVIVAGTHWGAVAEAKRLTMDGKHYGLVKVYNEFELKQRSDVMVHELGHIAGLRHDHDNKLSIMYPSSASRVASLEAQDVAALRSLYLARVQRYALLP